MPTQAGGTGRWSGTGSDVGNASALWVVPASGAQIDFFDNADYTYRTASFTVPTGFTASLSGKVLRDNAVTAITLDQGATHTSLGGEAANNSKNNFGAGGFPPAPLNFGSSTDFVAGTYTVTFTVHNENLLGAPGVPNTNMGVAYPNSPRPAPNPTGIIFCFTVTPKVVFRPVALFVIGDVEDHAVGDNVNFWGAQWWKNNFMSGQVDNGVASFKGFAVQSDNVCGGTWTSLPGNSSNPPDVIGADIAIIVTTKVLKDGPNISGDIKQIVIVHQDGGYGPNPGHAGNGPVTSVFCTAP